MLLLPMLELLESDEDKQKFEKIYEKYLKLVMSVSLKRIHDYHFAEENCQDVFWAIAKHFDKVKDIDSPETEAYVYTVATGFAINKYKKEIEKRPLSLDFDKNVKNFEKTFDIYSEGELKTAIENLSDEGKTYFRLKHIYGFSLKEIGKMFGESVSTVSRKVNRAVYELRERLGDNNE